MVPLIDRLLTLDPGTPEAEQQQHAIEHVLMATLANSGRHAGEALVYSLVAHGYELQRLDALPCMCQPYVKGNARAFKKLCSVIWFHCMRT